ncbi:MAG: acyl-CoA thioesterase [Flavobacteriaceae bacterium]|nr:acyl-CoA thioesterase [Flavobacteriaceae bacterium]
MNDLPKILESTTKIRFQDCDPFNHLNNASYINYLINAREDQLIKYYNIDIYKMARELGKSWVVGSNQITYIKPAFLMEEVIIDSQLLEFSASSLKVEIRMWNHSKTEIKAVMWSSFVHFNLLKQTREEHSESLMNMFESVVNPVESRNFEERTMSFRKMRV